MASNPNMAEAVNVHRRRRDETQERVVRAMKRWEAQRGKAPTANDWRVATGLQWPRPDVAVKAFGSWAAALAAAGLTAERGGPVAGDSDAGRRAGAAAREVMALGVTVSDAAKRFRVSPAAVSGRVKKLKAQEHAARTGDG